jgi:uncharacterized caspase-like protein
MRRKRSALVIGNGAYTGNNVTVLKNPKNDAIDISEKLKSYGFDIKTAIDFNLQDLRKSLKDYKDLIEAGGVSLVFFAGHGIQIEGENFLFATDTDASGEDEAKWSSLSLDQIIDALEKSGAETKIIILDACRENPFEKAWGRSGPPRGLASVFVIGPHEVVQG